MMGCQSSKLFILYFTYRINLRFDLCPFLEHQKSHHYKAMFITMDLNLSWPKLEETHTIIHEVKLIF